MQTKRGNKLIQAERIALFQKQRQKKSEYNPQQKATNNLLEISDQDCDFLADQVQSFPQIKMERQSSFRSDNGYKIGSKKEGKVHIAQNFTKSHKNWRKSSVNYISGEQVCVMKKEKAVNLSSFLIFQNQQLINFSFIPQKKIKAENELQSTKPNLKPKISKNIINFIRRRYIQSNIDSSVSPQKQPSLNESNKHKPKSPTIRLNKSCELKRDKQPLAPLLQYSTRIENIYSPDFRSTSPNFRNKKVVNYFKYKLSKNGEK